MGYYFSPEGINKVISGLSEKYDIFAPKLFAGKGAFSDTDLVRYDRISAIEDVVFHMKSRFSSKEVLLPLTQTLFYYTEDSVSEPRPPVRDRLIFLRSCDLHAVRRLDAIYLGNVFEDHYYRQLRDHTKFVLMGCSRAFSTCFCVDMETNIPTGYDMSIDLMDGEYRVDCRSKDLEDFLVPHSIRQGEVVPCHVTETPTRVHIPENLSSSAAESSIWKEYDSRCIACGRCNFSCPTCTCFTMQDLSYTDNPKAGERRRVWASCMVDGFTEVAGGAGCRKAYGERMRFKVLHKALDFKKRNGYQMCVGCGRCDDVCPEYISFSGCLNKLEEAMEEVNGNDKK